MELQVAEHRDWRLQAMLEQLQRAAGPVSHTGKPLGDGLMAVGFTG
jgi:hypothetical protein